MQKIVKSSGGCSGTWEKQTHGQIRSMVAIDRGHPQSKANVDTIEYIMSSCDEDASPSPRSETRVAGIFKDASADEDFQLINYVEEGTLNPGSNNTSRAQTDHPSIDVEPEVKRLPVSPKPAVM